MSKCGLRHRTAEVSDQAISNAVSSSKENTLELVRSGKACSWQQYFLPFQTSWWFPTCPNDIFTIVVFQSPLHMLSSGGLNREKSVCSTHLPVKERKNTTRTMNNLDEELLCQNTNVYHAAAVKVSRGCRLQQPVSCRPRLYLQMMPLPKQIISISMQLSCWRALMSQEPTSTHFSEAHSSFFSPFLPFSSVQWSTSGSLFLTPLYHPTPFLSPGSPDFTLCHRQLGMRDHLQRCFCHQKPAGCEVLHQGTRQLPSTFGVRTAKKRGRYSLAEKLLTNSTAQWWLWKPFFKNNTIHPPYLHRLLPQPFPASASSLQRPKSFLAPRVIQIKLLCNQYRA